MKHSPLPWRVENLLDPSPFIYDAENSPVADLDNYVDTVSADQDNARFIVRACNHFEEMRRTLCFVADAALVPVNISLMAQELLDKLEADE